MNMIRKLTIFQTRETPAKAPTKIESARPVNYSGICSFAKISARVFDCMPDQIAKTGIIDKAIPTGKEKNVQA